MQIFFNVFTVLEVLVAAVPALAVFCLALLLDSEAMALGSFVVFFLALFLVDAGHRLRQAERSRLTRLFGPRMGGHVMWVPNWLTSLVLGPTTLGLGLLMALQAASFEPGVLEFQAADVQVHQSGGAGGNSPEARQVAVALGAGLDAWRSTTLGGEPASAASHVRIVGDRMVWLVEVPGFLGLDSTVRKEVAEHAWVEAQSAARDLVPSPVHLAVAVRSDHYDQILCGRMADPGEELGASKHCGLDDLLPWFAPSDDAANTAMLD